MQRVSLFIISMRDRTQFLSFYFKYLFLWASSLRVYNIADLHIRLPMALKKNEMIKAGSVSASRALLDCLGGHYGEPKIYLTKRKYYDFGTGDENAMNF